MTTYKIIIIGILFLFLRPEVQAQQTTRLFAENRYTELIRLLAKDGADLTQLDDRERQALGLAYLRRGYFFDDLARLQRDLGKDFYFYRDTSSTVIKVALSKYFLGRYLYESNQFRQALQRFKACFHKDDIPAKYRRFAKIWAGACLQKLDKSSQAQKMWISIKTRTGSAAAAELSYARWRTQQVAPKNYAHSVRANLMPVKQLWLAWFERNLAAVVKLQESLVDGIKADAEKKVLRFFSLRFYDPAVLGIMANADFFAASEVLRTITAPKTHDRATFWAGVSAFEMQDYALAKLFLETSIYQPAQIYSGALLAVKGDIGGAKQSWESISLTNSKTKARWLDIVSRFNSGGKEIKHRINQATGNVRSREEAWYLGRALCRLHRYDQARSILQDKYPAQYNNDPTRIAPSFLVVLARAKYLVGRRYLSEMLGHLMGLHELYPVVLPAIDLAQGLLAPEDVAKGDEKRTSR